MGMWSDQARATIQAVHERLPDSATLAERTAALDAAYPFGMRAYSPYKTWLKARREYLCRYGYQARNAPPESPLERMMRKAGA